MDRKHILNYVIDATTMHDAFISQVKSEGPDRYIPNTDYIEVLQPIIGSVNPFCRFTRPRSRCVVKKNRKRGERRVNDRINCIAVKLGCEVSDCPALVNVNVMNPSGDVALSFLQGNEVKKSNQAGVASKGKHGVQTCGFAFSR